ncbi:DUF3600 domain-containing protein [Bacillus sp. FJAT-29790]|uniref:DUF3600 domain-containing protein n=1 Tax=Bacillus sp. FJAT-29790 TaxID=1895002 RepID=UPI001C23E6F8|nr:DUF3600 domain-containing protein [Bacillus sp. FJAT-29790]MBU8879790.1 DUF3600 domain-containing protein [Bacillus sp. FJAT-29790]
MNFDQRLRESLQEKGKELIPSPALKVKVMSSITNRRGLIKKRLVTSSLIALLVIPTSAFAYQSFIADEIYGSFDNLKKHISNATMEGYLLLSAKLSQAKGELGKEDYEQFKELLNVVTSAKIEYADQYGNIDYDKVPPEKVAEIEKGLMEIQPYFDRLNGQKSSKEVLTSEEYKQYIEFLMTYEKVIVQSELNPSEGSIEVEMILPHLQAEFLQARNFISYVNDKQNQ